MAPPRPEYNHQSLHDGLFSTKIQPPAESECLTRDRAGYIISALPPNLSAELIAQYVDRFRATGPLVGERITAAKERFDYYLVPVPLVRIQDYVLATIKYYGSNAFEFLQLVYPDTELLFPGEEGYDYDQELFGAFPPKQRA